MNNAPPRVLPLLTEENRPFWTGGAKGELLIMLCPNCGQYIHPPSPMCPHCHCREVAPRAVSGRAKVMSYTINHMQWQPGLPVPYIVAIVELEEQPGLYLTTEIIHCAIDAVAIDMPVRVVFEQQEDIYLPLFEPVTTGEYLR